MSSHGDRFRPRPGLIPAAFKFPAFQSLCVGGLDTSAYLASTMTSPALMVLASTAADNQCRSYSSGQVIEKESSLPFSTTSFPGRPMFSQTDTYPGHLLPVHYPHGLDRQVGFLSPTPGGAFRPLTMSDERGFHGSAFMPTQCLKLEQNPNDPQHLSMNSCFHNNETSTFLSPPSSISTSSSTLSSLGHVKGECGQEKDAGPDRLTDTPISEGAESNDGSILGDYSGLKKIKRRILVDGQIPFCPVCGITLRLPELSTHFQFEVERLAKISKNLSQSSQDGSTCSRTTSSPAGCRRKEDEKPETRWDTYQRVKSNRQNRLSARTCTGKKKKFSDEMPCPVCSVTRLPLEMAEHIPACARKGNGEPMEAECMAYHWTGQRRLLPQDNDKRQQNQDDDSQDLNVDCDDTVTFGQPQYTEADVASAEEAGLGREVDKLPQPNESTKTDSTAWNNNEAQEISSTTAATEQRISDGDEIKVNGTEVDLQKIDDTLRCFICMELYTKPVVSVCCWHVHCEECWLRTLGIKKLCPQCSVITGARDLRRIYL